MITALFKLFKVNPPTAYNMLSEFVDLRPGDFVIQNGANSAVGISVMNAEQLLIYHDIIILVDFRLAKQSFKLPSLEVSRLSISFVIGM